MNCGALSLRRTADTSPASAFSSYPLPSRQVSFVLYRPIFIDYPHARFGRSLNSAWAKGILRRTNIKAVLCFLALVCASLCCLAAQAQSETYLVARRGMETASTYHLVNRYRELFVDPDSPPTKQNDARSSMEVTQTLRLDPLPKGRAFSWAYLILETERQV